MEQKIDQLEINGVKYVRADQVTASVPNGKRAIVVADRGWIFAGDVEEKDGRILLSRAVHVLNWTSIGYAGLIASGGRGNNVTVKKLTTVVDLPSDSELFRNPVEDNWGL